MPSPAFVQKISDNPDGRSAADYQPSAFSYQRVAVKVAYFLKVGNLANLVTVLL